MATQPPPPPPQLSAIDFVSVISVAKRIINAHSRHFLALSVLFLLPLSFSLTVFPTLHNLLLSRYSPNPNRIETLVRLSLHQAQPQPQPQPPPLPAIIITIAYILFVSVLSLFATSSIAYSVIHGFFGRPVKLICAVKSIAASFLPLLLTSICRQAIMTLIGGILGIILLLTVKGIQLIAPRIDYSSPYFVALSILILLLYVLILVNLQVNWTLASVVVVAESEWGFYPLKRSSYLVNGMRRLALSMILFFGSCFGILLWACSGSTLESMDALSGWKSWSFVLGIVAVSSLLTALMLLSLAANVVMYMYCKAMHGELAMEIAEEFARDYVSLPFDDGKVPHVVSVSYTCT